MSTLASIGRVAVVATALAAAAWPHAGRSSEFVLTGSAWQISEVAGAPAQAGATITFTRDRAFGFGGCNRYSAPVSVLADGIHLGGIVSTKMFCADRMGGEQAVFAALAKVRSAGRVAAGGIVLRDANGATVMKLQR